jgi:D-tyrosyl-tRNA(Tyr) deacylase
MIAVVQRVTCSSVTVDGEVVGSINQGFNVLLGVAESDTDEDSEWIAKKILGMRVFSDEEGKMNKDLKDIDGNILLISQFTLLANTKKGNRPSFIEAARPEKAIPMYERMILMLSEGLGKPIAKGIFGADMKVDIQNDGPVTIVLDSQNKR